MQFFLKLSTSAHYSRNEKGSNIFGMPGCAVQALESGSLAGTVVGACIGTALLYTVVLLLVKFAVFLWSKIHRSVIAICFN